MNGHSDGFSTLPMGRVLSGLPWQADAMRSRIREVRGDGVLDHTRCLFELRFALPPLDTMRHHSLTYPWTDPIAALHIDAGHAYEAVWNDIQKCTPFIVENGICVFDDYDVSHPGMTRAVHRLLDKDASFEVVGDNYQGREFGSLCLRSNRQPA